MSPLQTVFFIVFVVAAAGIAVLLIQDVFQALDQKRLRDEMAAAARRYMQ